MDNSALSEYTQWLTEWESLSRLHAMYHYAGPWDAPIVVVGQREKGATLPFISNYGTQFAWECLGLSALTVGWTYAQEVPPQHLRTKNGIISCGEKPSKWLKFYVNEDVEIIQIPDLRYFLTRQSIAETTTIYDLVREFIENYKKEGT